MYMYMYMYDMCIYIYMYICIYIYIYIYRALIFIGLILIGCPLLILIGWISTHNPHIIFYGGPDIKLGKAEAEIGGTGVKLR